MKIVCPDVRLAEAQETMPFVWTQIKILIIPRQQNTSDPMSEPQFAFSLCYLNSELFPRIVVRGARAPSRRKRNERFPEHYFTGHLPQVPWPIGATLDSAAFMHRRFFLVASFYSDRSTSARVSFSTVPHTTTYPLRLLEASSVASNLSFISNTLQKGKTQWAHKKGSLSRIIINWNTL